MSVLEGPLVYVDIETNGLSYSRCRVIEVAAIRVENGKIVNSLNHLLDPGTQLPPFITQLTGITNQDVAGAPLFGDIAQELYDIIDGAVFVAHNVRFDYSFLKQEFARVGQKFSPTLLCTVKLSRSMYPAERSHKLANIIDRCGIAVASRHRAYDDALAMHHFINHLAYSFPAELIEQAIAKQIKAPSLPRQLSARTVTSLPGGPGVYIFEDESGSPLYIGKSINIKKRVLSHFSSDHSSQTEFKISQGIANVDFRSTAGELEALLLESKLIKEMQPLYNRMLRRTQKLTLARQRLDDRGYINLNIEDVDAIDPEMLGEILSVYTTKGKARIFLRDIARTYGFCPRLLGLEKGSGPCFSFQLNKCRGACVGEHSVDDFNSLLLDIFSSTSLSGWPFSSPILVQEITDSSEEYRSLVIDKWCVIAEISQPANCSPSVKYHSRVFDIDTYRIIKSYIDNKRHKLNIQPVSLADLEQMQTAAA